MRLDTRTYTNVLLTIIAALLFVLVLRPQLGVVENAYARGEEQRARELSVAVQESRKDLVESARQIAKANQKIATAIERLAQSTERIASELGRMASK